jgi:hypothetical protein
LFVDATLVIIRCLSNLHKCAQSSLRIGERQDVFEPMNWVEEVSLTGICILNLPMKRLSINVVLIILLLDTVEQVAAL